MTRPRRGSGLPLAVPLLLGALCLALGAAAKPANDVAIMRKLRRVLNQVDPTWVDPWRGWQPHDDPDPCGWDRVECNTDHQVAVIRLYSREETEVGIFSDSEPKPLNGDLKLEGPERWGPLIPELAQLEGLRELSIQRFPSPRYSGMPPEWGRPGAFPRLRQMTLMGLHYEEGLPDMLPGAMPALEHLYLDMVGGASHLPDSWGSHPATLPALRTLNVMLQLLGPLPPAWGPGFRDLEHLIITGARGVAPKWGRGAATHPTAGSVGGLPAQWAAPDSFPSLRHISLSGIGLTGSIPEQWVRGGFTLLEELSLDGNVTGTLPEDLFAHKPRLTHLSLEHSQLNGTLPPAWAASKVEHILLIGNQLSGPAIPPAWLRPGALSELRYLDLTNNSGLTGTLPSALLWPNIQELLVGGTAMEGQIPDSWCHAPMATRLGRIDVHGTEISQLPPSCTAQAMRDAVFILDGGTYVAGRSMAPPLPASRLASLPPLVVAALAVALLLATLALGAAAGRFLWHSRRGHRRRRAAGEEGGEEAQDAHGLLLHGQQHSSRQHSAASEREREHSLSLTLPCSSSTSKPSTVNTVLGRGSRRARMAAALSAQLVSSSGGPMGGPGSVGLRPGCVGLLPVDALPTVLAHHLGSLRAAAAAAASQRTGTAAPVNTRGIGVHTLGGGRIAEGSAFLGAASDSHGCLGAQRAAEVEAWAADALAAGAPEGSGREGMPPHSRQWGMATDSMRLGADQLEFVVDSDGGFVELGAGSYAIVYLARLGGQYVAVKVFELEAGTHSGKVWHEVSLLRRCVHPRIVPLLGVALKSQLVLLAMEVMRGGSLRLALQQPEWQARLRWGDRGCQVALDVAEALDFLHSKQVIHSDLKAANVLLSHDGRACLADLGLAQVLAGNAATAAGFSRAYAAPEQLLGQRCTLAADVYSFGILLNELLTQQHQDARGKLRLPRAPTECPQAVATLIAECVSVEPLTRPTAAQALARLRAAAAESV